LDSSTANLIDNLFLMFIPEHTTSHQPFVYHIPSVSLIRTLIPNHHVCPVHEHVAKHGSTIRTVRCTMNIPPYRLLILTFSSTLADLVSSTDPLTGMDALELRGWASQNPIVPSRDLGDPLGKAMLAALQGEENALRNYLDVQTKELGDETVLKELSEARWGPTRVPIYNVILIFFIHRPGSKAQLLELTRHLAYEIKVPVDGRDVTGATALYWSISTKPFTEPEFAQVLFDAGGDVNEKNRFGGTAASEIAQADLAGDTSRNVAMLKWYIEHGGDVDVKDNDGMNVRMLVDMMQKRVPALMEVVKNGKGPRKEGQCANCGRSPGGAKTFSTCSRCKQARYCSQNCQKVDWKMHKKTCTAAK
jgi:hypothetical protein